MCCDLCRYVSSKFYTNSMQLNINEYRYIVWISMLIVDVINHDQYREELEILLRRILFTTGVGVPISRLRANYIVSHDGSSALLREMWRICEPTKYRHVVQERFVFRARRATRKPTRCDASLHRAWIWYSYCSSRAADHLISPFIHGLFIRELQIIISFWPRPRVIRSTDGSLSNPRMRVRRVEELFHVQGEHFYVVQYIYQGAKNIDFENKYLVIQEILNIHVESWFKIRSNMLYLENWYKYT